MVQRARRRALEQGKTTTAEVRLHGIWTGTITIPVGLLMYVYQFIFKVKKKLKARIISAVCIMYRYLEATFSYRVLFRRFHHPVYSFVCRSLHWHGSVLFLVYLSAIFLTWAQPSLALVVSTHQQPLRLMPQDFAVQIVSSVCYTYSCNDCYNVRSNDASICFGYVTKALVAMCLVTDSIHLALFVKCSA
jgi:hypothetical protein